VFKYLSLTTAFDSQWTDDEVFSTEAFYLGGVSSVRGFHDDSTMGDSGFWFRNDLSLNLGEIFSSKSPWLTSFSPGVFFDYGRVFPNVEGRRPASLSGWGVKLGFKYLIFDASASWARVIEREAWMQEDSALYLNIGINYRF
jgi:hemolysin activation/secretion protein